MIQKGGELLLRNNYDLFSFPLLYILHGNHIDPNEASALYLNNYDLGFGRDMHMRWDDDGNVYAYVENYPTVESGLKKLSLKQA